MSLERQTCGETVEGGYLVSASSGSLGDNAAGNVAISPVVRRCRLALYKRQDEGTCTEDFGDTLKPRAWGWNIEAQEVETVIIQEAYTEEKISERISY